jgi:hypothetical protein
MLARREAAYTVLKLPGLTHVYFGPEQTLDWKNVVRDALGAFTPRKMRDGARTWSGAGRELTLKSIADAVCDRDLDVVRVGGRLLKREVEATK